MKHTGCKHYYVDGMGITCFAACRERRGGCVACCLECSLREPQVVRGGWEMPGCDRACPGPEHDS